MTPRSLTPESTTAWRSIVTTLDAAVNRAEENARHAPSEFTRAERDAWRVAQQAVARRFARLQVSAKE